MNPELIKVKINQAILSQDHQLLQQYACDLRSAISEADKSLEQYFEVLLELLTQENLLDMESAWDFFFILKNCRELLSDFQKQKLILNIESVYKSFDEVSLDQIQKDIHQAIFNKNIIEFKKSIDELSNGLFGVNHFPSEIFEFVISLLKQENLLELNGSWHLFTFIEFNWELISSSQKNQLLSSLEIAYVKFQEWMSHFIISEILGEYFANEQAFELLCRLGMLDNENHRSFIPHGLEHIIKGSDNKELSQKAYIHLLQMKSDPSEKVRDEVEESLQQLAI